MEGSITKLFEEFQQVNNLPENFPSGNCTNDSEISEKNFKDEETLRIHLDNLKHQNFMLQANIKAWQKTLRKKLEDFKNADSKLDEIYSEIWSERENFCLKAEEFNDSFGVLSDWWAAQMKFVSDLENLEQKAAEDEKSREEIKLLEKEVEELRTKAEELQMMKEVAEVEVHATAEGDSTTPRNSAEKTEKMSPEKTDSKKIRFSGEEERIEVCGEGGDDVAYDLYSLVDVEKVPAEALSCMQETTAPR